MIARPVAARGIRLLTIFSAFTLAGCWHTNPGDTEALEPAKIIFVNESLSQADVFAVIPGVESRRLGSVFPGSTDTLNLPGNLAIRGDITLVARLLAGRTIGSSLLGIRPGEAMRVTLPVDQRMLSVLPAP